MLLKNMCLSWLRSTARDNCTNGRVLELYKTFINYSIPEPSTLIVEVLLMHTNAMNALLT